VRAILIATLALPLLAIPASAHHSFAAEYDATKPIAFSGTVTKVEWMNPHVRFFLDVKDERGNTTSWELTMGSATGLMRRGWKKDLLKPGITVKVDGYRARDGSQLANLRTIVFADGSRMFTGAPPDAPGGGNQ
jgi:hypothetical protein